MKNVQEMAKKFENVESVKKELKRIQSVKCRIKKQKAREDYEEKMQEILNQEQLMKEVKQYFEPKTKTVTNFTKEDIADLNYEETMKAIKSIQSKKCNTQYLTSDIEANAEYQRACEIEEMLLDHKSLVKPIEDTVIKKSDIHNLIDHIEDQEQKIDKDYVLQLLKELV